MNDVTGLLDRRILLDTANLLRLVAAGEPAVVAVNVANDLNGRHVAGVNVDVSRAGLYFDLRNTGDFQCPFKTAVFAGESGGREEEDCHECGEEEMLVLHCSAPA